MRGVTVDVPAQAKERLDLLTLLRDSALEASRSCQSRLNALPDDGDKLAILTAKERDRQATAHNVLGRLLSACNQYLFQLRLPNGYYLEPVSTPVTLKKGETPAEAIDAIRSQIAAVQREMALVRSAPLKKQSRQDAIHSYLARLALAARPRINFDRDGNAQLRWREDFATMNDVVGLLALICPAELVNAFQLDAEPDTADAISPGEREQKLSDLAAKLLEFERKEEVLLRACDGILPRPEMSPEAFLQIRIALAPLATEAAAVCMN
jgi:hypothetical protein